MGKFRRYIIPLLAALVLSMVAVPCAFAEATVPAYDTGSKVITINSANDLEWVSEYSQNSQPDETGIPVTFKGYTLKVTADITLGEDWTPITLFEGTINGEKGEGDYYSISNIQVNTSGAAGLCAKASGATFENLGISNSSIVTSTNYAGAFAGDGFTSSFTNCHTYNVNVSGYRFVGGIVGSAYGNIKNCSVLADDNSKYSIIAKSTLSDSLRGIDGDNVGGIIGYIGEGNTVISGCYVTNVTISGVRQVGGIAGLENYGNTISGCIVDGCCVVSRGTLSLLKINGHCTPAVGGVVGQFNASDETSKIYLNDNIVSNTTITQTYTRQSLYAGAIVGDATYGDSGTCYALNDNNFSKGVQVYLGSALQDPTPEIGNK
jgi:hypothetical protein